MKSVYSFYYSILVTVLLQPSILHHARLYMAALEAVRDPSIRLSFLSSQEAFKIGWNRLQRRIGGESNGFTGLVILFGILAFLSVFSKDYNAVVILIMLLSAHCAQVSFCRLLAPRYHNVSNLRMAVSTALFAYQWISLYLISQFVEIQFVKPDQRLLFALLFLIECGILGLIVQLSVSRMKESWFRIDRIEG